MREQRAGTEAHQRKELNMVLPNVTSCGDNADSRSSGRPQAARLKSREKMEAEALERRTRVNLVALAKLLSARRNPGA
jgi:hypothetical protein